MNYSLNFDIYISLYKAAPYIVCDFKRYAGKQSNNNQQQQFLNMSIARSTAKLFFFLLFIENSNPFI